MKRINKHILLFSRSLCYMGDKEEMAFNVHWEITSPSPPTYLDSADGFRLLKEYKKC